jgi:hypothetical protein
MSERVFCSRRATTTSDPRARCASGKIRQNCREVTIRRPKIRSYPIRPFRRGQEIVQMCLRLWRLVRGRRRQAFSVRGWTSPHSVTGSTGCRQCRASI